MASIRITHSHDIPPEFADENRPFLILYKLDFQLSQSGDHLLVRVNSMNKPELGFCMSRHEAREMGKALQDYADKMG